MIIIGANLLQREVREAEQAHPREGVPGGAEGERLEHGAHGGQGADEARRLVGGSRDREKGC